MTNRIFLDSSILVETTKGTQTDLYEYLVLPNDALILATCKLNGITQIAPATTLISYRLV